MILAILWTLIAQPILWLTHTVIVLAATLLGLTIAWRFYWTAAARMAPGWPLAGNKLKPIKANQAILITGATSGIGLAVAKHLYRSGYSILAAYYDSNEMGYAELKQLSQQQPQQQRSSKTSMGPKLFLVALDVRDEKSIARAYEQVSSLLEEHKLELYSLINNAGLGSLQPFAWLQRQSIRNLVDTNLIGNLLMAREFMPLLVRSRGRLLFVSSGLGLVPGATYTTYGVTKCALIHLARCLNLEVKKRYGVQCVAMIPHNFIKNTNICSMNVRNNELAWQELKPIEKTFYQDEFDRHCRRARSLDDKLKEQLRKRASNHKLQQKSTTATGTSGKSFVSKVSDVLTNIKASLSGQCLAESLEESGILESFEDALRLENPPELMFAGDTTFQMLIGSLLLSLPTSCAGLLSTSVAPSLYK